MQKKWSAAWWYTEEKNNTSANIDTVMEKGTMKNFENDDKLWFLGESFQTERAKIGAILTLSYLRKLFI